MRAPGPSRTPNRNNHDQNGRKPMGKEVGFGRENPTQNMTESGSSWRGNSALRSLIDCSVTSDHRPLESRSYGVSWVNAPFPSCTTTVDYSVDNLPALWETMTSSPGVMHGHDRPVETVETRRYALVPSNLGKPQTIHNPQVLLLPLYLST